ncbi:MAG: ImmA/IrrE family metallo-endopeptidase, partial [Bacteroidia bacterium]
DLGYKEAQDLRSLIGLNGQIIDSNSVIEQKLNISDSALFNNDNSNQITISNRSIRALLAIKDNDQPGFVFFAKAEPSFFNEQNRRFTFCRLLREYLFNQNPYSLITESKDFMQKRNKAFAAEFLAPANTLKKKITTSKLSDDDIDDLATELNVSSLVIRHQIENHKIAEIISNDIY